jgi:diguanylate cyclase (GGDEF)-like protein
MSSIVFELSPEEKRVLNELPNAIGVYQYADEKIVPVFLSEHFLDLFGYDSEEQAMADAWMELYRNVHPDDAARVQESRYQFAANDSEFDVFYRNKTGYQTEYHIIHETGRHVWRNGTKLDYITYADESRSLNKNGKAHLSECFLQRASLGNDLHRNQFDDLTRLPTIGRFFQNVPESIRAMRKRGKIPAVLWMDYSRLRDYNALHGFENGDTLIRGLAWLIRDQFGSANTARFNTDYFVACTDTDRLEEDIRHIFEGAAKLNQGNSRPVATGIYVMEDESIRLAAAVDRAKIACDSLDEPVNSTYVYFDQKMLARAELKQYVLQNYQRAMKEGWIQVYYQPVIRTITGRLCGAEALCRWKDPEYGMISPGEFIPALEEVGRIWDLDRYMVEQVCRDGRRLMRAGVNLVPVSVNLSRKDFRESELVDQIEALAKKYTIPRELLNIEITESAFIRHPERLSKYISLFHELGFQVWMDDFGTAYSTLGSLKDLKFDELKIDMSFLATSTDKARSIIASVVHMAKTIGIQTLAEGVETAEQYEFLKRIGCEKVQGYYFGKPMDRRSFRQHCAKMQIEAEPLRWRNYYDALSRIHYQTDEPLCVIEDDGVSFQPLFVNDAYREVLRRDHIYDFEKWMREVNACNNPVHALHRQFADEQLRKLPGPQVITYPSGDHYMELTGKIVTHYENSCIYTWNIRYLKLDTMPEDQKKAFYIQYIYYLCSDMTVIDLKNSTAYGLKTIDSSQPTGAGGKTVDLARAVQIYLEQFVYAPDQERYDAFADPKTLRARMREKSGHDLTGFFRIKTKDRTYRWMLHMIMPIPKSDFNRYINVTFPIDLDPDLRRLLLDMEDRENEERSDHSEERKLITPSVLWQNLKINSDGMYFWKDMNRRFLGASRSFLEFYGFKSEKEIIGKTDEDMHWHVEPDAFKQDELDVLLYGRTFRLVEGKCIARGKQRTILASKIPIYRDGKIIGLMGSFFDADNLVHLLDNRYQSILIDEATDLFNARGISESLKDYLEALWSGNTEFSMIQVNIPEYSVFDDIYGEKAGNELLRSVGEILREIFGRESSIGRLTGSYFIILIQNVEPQHIQAARTRIQEEISRLRRVGEWQCALSAEVRIAVLNKKNASREVYAKSLDHMLMGFGVFSQEEGPARYNR